MRSMLEIVRLVRTYMETEKRYGGMCSTAGEMWCRNLLTEAERARFTEYIKLFRPKLRHKGNSLFFFRPGDKRPRRKFLDRLIKQLEEQCAQSVPQ